METKKYKTQAIALCTGYGSTTSLGWLIFTHHVGFASPVEAVKDLARELVLRYKQRELDLGREGEPLNQAKFIAFINQLSRASWADYGNPDTVNGEPIRWWPFTDVGELITMKHQEVVTLPCLGGEILLAAVDPALIESFDLKEICEHLPEIAKMLGLKLNDAASKITSIITA